MKTKSMYLTAFLVLSLATGVLANDEPGKSTLVIQSAKGSEVFKIIYKGENSGKVKLNLYNDKSELIFKEALTNTDGFILPLNFSKLAFGEYKLELIDGNGKKVEQITYQPVSAVSHIRIAKIANSDKFLVSVNKTGSETVTVKIFDGVNNLLHNEVKTIDGGFAQIYVVKNISGACTFEVSDDTGNVRTARF